MARALLMAPLVLCLACPPAPPPAPSLSSRGGRLTWTPDGTLTLWRGDRPLVRLLDDAFQVGTVRELDPNQSYDPYWLVVEDPVLQKAEPPGFRWRRLTSASVTQPDASSLRLEAVFESDVQGVVTVTATASGFALRFVPDVASRPVAMLRVRTHTDATEGFYGLGEWFDEVNHRGKVRPLQLEPDLGVESSSTENHVTTTFHLGTRGWGAFFETRRYGVISFARGEDDLVDAMFGTADESAAGLTMHLFTADEPLDLLKPYLEVTGEVRLPSPWAWGPLLWRDESRNQAEVLDDIATLRRLDLATSAMWVDRPYATAVNTFDFDPAKYPDAGAMIRTAHAAGLRFSLWHTPYLEPTAAPLRTRAEAEGWFPRSTGVLLNRWSPPLDFTNPAAAQAWRQALTSYRALGVEGFKLDFAEDVVAGVGGVRSGWGFADGSTEKTMHHDYTRLYHRAYRDTLGALDGLLLVRAGKWGSQTDGVVVWPGDVDANLSRFGESFTTRGGRRFVGVGGLPSVVRAGQSLSMSGFPFFGADTGGYRHSPPDKETFMRWVSQSALSTVMQTGDSSSQPPWVFTPENGRDDEAVAHYRRFARLHLRLFPYGWTYATRLKDTGRPLQRPFGVAFPGLGLHPADQYLLGDDLLVAPVERAGAREKTLVRPPGDWQGWFDGRPLEGAPGASITVPAPLDALPLFVRAGALVPMLRPTIDTLSPASDADVDSFANEAGDLWVRVVPAATASSFVVYDGTRLEQQQGDDGLVLRSQAGAVFTGAVVYEVLAPRPGSVEADGGALPFVADVAAVPRGVAWADGVLRVKAPLGARVVVK
ncbi:MAG: glycoside hydrolase family 31 protein [Myxococcaceae bacterium]|jgi:alpha-D-xyloside xylohydrolase|nr:glycoside hydrolase family 31 protein [Myxococcaceae bacterium]MCA3014758.1 glycoside hydrolase family 31 protein [Myxococcaceae bacterium]